MQTTQQYEGRTMKKIIESFIFTTINRTNLIGTQDSLFPHSTTNQKPSENPLRRADSFILYGVVFILLKVGCIFVAFEAQNTKPIAYKQMQNCFNSDHIINYTKHLSTINPDKPYGYHCNFMTVQTNLSSFNIYTCVTKDLNAISQTPNFTNIQCGISYNSNFMTFGSSLYENGDQYRMGSFFDYQSYQNIVYNTTPLYSEIISAALELAILLILVVLSGREKVGKEIGGYLKVAWFLVTLQIKLIMFSFKINHIIRQTNFAMEYLMNALYNIYITSMYTVNTIIELLSIIGLTYMFVVSWESRFKVANTPQ